MKNTLNQENLKTLFGPSFLEAIPRHG